MKHWTDTFAAEIAGATVGISFLLLAFVVVPAYFEASAFNQLTTGPKVSIFDAVFLDLCVEAK
jgi:hypothetical protein